MRAFVTCKADTADAIWRDGWKDLHNICGTVGIHLSDRPLDIREGFEGPMVLCLDVPDYVFEKYELIEVDAFGQEHVPGDPIPGAQLDVAGISEEAIEQRETFRPGQKFSAFGSQPGSYRYAVIPAARLNEIGKPQVYDHEYAGSSRRVLLQAAEGWEGHADEIEKAAAEKDWEKRAAQVRRNAKRLRDAIAFLDRIGWLTPVKLQEEAAKVKAKRKG
jgi:hypothetical protein